MKSKKPKKQARIAIILETTGVREDHLVDMIDRMLDVGSIQNAIRECAEDTDDMEKLKVTLASVEPTGDSATALQRDALAAELVQYAKALATIVEGSQALEGVLDAYGIDKDRVRNLAKGGRS